MGGGEGGVSPIVPSVGSSVDLPSELSVQSPTQLPVQTSGEIPAEPTVGLHPKLSVLPPDYVQPIV